MCVKVNDFLNYNYIYLYELNDLLHV